ncbi:Permease of the drug/metabolite transporter (DMT) superfamily [Actinacidiphila yanglinensis]|uniref:Permease of the drug/metabolite transporter (DMT) superfamily n=1 Tax=Actinacidiphila yanglinensis TaxID=310779 RepID=A0A1H6CDX4_9ACTN|nr:DMT family transporter [Actinacidiphila yanglinensis]SEG70835.1 Permease of the drug/metabolite transporter (DMT) superfamily [Actinacidiphila yanglinensis]
MNSSHRTGVLLSALACVLVGASFTAGGALVHYPHAGGQALRYGAAFLLLAGPARRSAARLRALRLRHWLLAAAVAGVGMVGFNLSVLAAERTAQPAVPGVLVGCAPVVVAVLVPLATGRRPTRSVAGGAVLVAAGAFAVQGWGGTDGRGLAWSVAALGGEVGFALLAAPLVRPLGPLLLSTCVCGFAALEAGVLAAAGDGFRVPTAPQALALGWQSVVATVIGFVCWYAGFQRLGTERATLFSGLIPVAAALTAPVVSVGTLGIGQLAGSGLVAAGVAVGSGALRGVEPRAKEDVGERSTEGLAAGVTTAVAADGQRVTADRRG